MSPDIKTDIWMPLAIGDYLADTAHLSTLEHGAYLLLLMHYWRKGPLPNDLAKIAQIAKLSTDAWSIAQALLTDFFSLHDDGMYHQKRSDREIAKWQGKRKKAQEKASAAAQARWKDHAPSNTSSNAQSNASSNASSNAQAMLGSYPLPKPYKNTPPTPSPGDMKEVDPPEPTRDVKAETVNRAWEYFKVTFDHNGRYHFSTSRRRLGERAYDALKKRCRYLDIPEEQHEQTILRWFGVAIDRLQDSPFHRGQNDQHKRYQDWENLFRSRDHRAPDHLTDYWLDDSKFKDGRE